MSDTPNDKLSRRNVVAAGAVTAAAAAVGVQAATSKSPQSPKGSPMSATRQPVVFLPHGGGPWPFVDLGMGSRAEQDQLASYLKSVGSVPKEPPKAVLVISAHWEERVPTVMTNAKPPLLFDYYGFPPEAYQLTWPAPGAPQVAARVREVLAQAGIESATDDSRGFDHGTFVPLKLTWPNADVPTLQLSLQAGLDPARHLAIGRALAPLRDEGVFIVGSGMTFHNLRAFFGDPRTASTSEAFDQWLQKVTTASPTERDDALTKWTQAPSARFVHPREEHLIPLMVIAGAAGADQGTVGYAGSMMGAKLSAYHFG